MRKKATRITVTILAAVLTMTSLTACGKKKNSDGTLTLTNVSYDPTRELYEEYNQAFEKHYKEEHGKDIKIIQSHGGSGSQARSVVEGSDADVVTLALAHDISLIEKSGLIEPGWIEEFDGNSAPYTSTIVFLVRKGNEKGIKDWDDLVKKGVDVITPDPKSSGGACWNFLAAWEYASEKYDSEKKVKKFVTDLYQNVLVLDSGARSATTSFAENGQGDVLIAWENEAITAMKEYPGKYEIVTPSVSILAEPNVAIVDANAKKDNTQEAAKEYLQYLYSDEAQRTIGENGYRPTNPDILQEFSDKFDLNVKLCTIDDFGGWDEAYEKFFTDGAIFDEIYDN